MASRVHLPKLDGSGIGIDSCTSSVSNGEVNAGGDGDAEMGQMKRLSRPQMSSTSVLWDIISKLDPVFCLVRQ